MTEDTEKAKVLNVFFTMVFTGKTGLQESHVPVTKGKVQSKETLLLLEKEKGREYLNKLGIHKSL